MFQRHDPVTYVRYDSLSKALCMLLSRFMQTEFVRNLTVGKPTKFGVENWENYFLSDNIFIGFVRNSMKILFDDGDKNQEQHNKFLSVWWSFHKISFAYAWKDFPLDNDVLKYARILKFHNQKWNWKNSVAGWKFKLQLKVSEKDTSDLEGKFHALGTLLLCL